MDELAVASASTRSSCGSATSPTSTPRTGVPFSIRNLVECLREGAERFGWADRDPAPGARRDGPLADRHRRGRLDLSRATARPPRRPRARDGDGRYGVEIGATDIGTGARTVLTQIAADALGRRRPERVRLRIGDTDFAAGAGGRRLDGHGVVGLGAWSRRAARRCSSRRRRRRGLGDDTGDEIKAAERARRATPSARSSPRSRVDADTRRDPRRRALLGVFAVGRIINPKTARSQLIGGMTHGPRDGAARGERHGPRARRLRHPRPRRSTTSPPTPTSTDIEATGSTRTTRRSTRWAPRASARSASSAPPRRSPTRCTTPPGVRVRDLPIRLDRVLV